MVFMEAHFCQEEKQKGMLRIINILIASQNYIQSLAFSVKIM